MRLILGIVLATAVAVVGSMVIGRRVAVTERIRFPSRDLFILVGILIGPRVFGVITEDALQELRPIIVIGLGWIGFLFGMNLEWRLLRRVTPAVAKFVAGESLLTMLLVAGAAVLTVRGLRDPMDHGIGLWPAVVALAACASGTAQGPLMRLQKERWFRGPAARVIQTAATLDDLPAILAIAVTAAVLHSYAATAGRIVAAANWFFIQAALGIAFGLILKFTMDRSEGAEAHLLVVLGTVGFAGGVAGMLHLSPLFVCGVAGATFVNVRRRESTVFPILRGAEFTVYVLFLVLVGCQWYPEANDLLLVTAMYLAVRAFGKVAGGFLWGRSAAYGERRPWIGLAMLPQGGMTIALAVDFARLSPSRLSDLLMTVVIFSVVSQGFLASPLAKRVVRRPER